MRRRILLFTLGALIFCSGISLAQPTFTIQNKKDACDGLSNGSFEVLVSSANPPPLRIFVFGPPDLGPINATVGTPLLISGLPGGVASGSSRSYIVVVQDADGSNFQLVNIVNTAANLSAVLSSSTNNSSCVAPDGTISITASGGSGGGYTFLWSGPNGFSSTSEDLTGLAGGSYTVVVSDNGTNCTRMLGPIVLTDPSPAVQNVTTPSPQPVCVGSSLTLNLAGSEAGVNYEVVRNNSVLTGIIQVGTGGALSFTVPSGTFANGDNFKIRATNGFCTPADMNGVVIANITPLPTAAVSGGGSVCIGSPTPNITFTFTGSAPYTFTYTDGTTPSTIINHPTTTFTITNATAGTYSVTALNDANGCVATNLGGTAQVIVNPLPTATLSGGGAACTGSPLPNITITFTGTAPYNFTWTNGVTPTIVTGHNSNTFTIPTAPAGTYSVTALSDANTCVGTSLGTPVNVVVNPLPTVSNVTGGGTVCAGSPLPNVTFTFTGTAPFNFTYTDGTTSFPIVAHNSTTFTITNAAAGTYSVTALSDANTCNATTLGASVPVVVNPLPTATISGGGATCTGSPLPSVTFTFTGTAPYNFTWTNGVTPTNVTGHNSNIFTIPTAAAGTYSVTALSDANTCVGTSFGTPVVVTVNPRPTVSNVAGGGTVCSGSPLPNVTFTFTGATPFNFTYTDGTTSFPIVGHNSTTFTVTNAAAGTYSITALADGNSCTATTLGGTAQVIVNPLPAATVSGGGTVCTGSPLPNINFTFTGTPPYNFTWTNGVTPTNVSGHNSNIFTIPNAAAGTYSVTALSDANTCVATSFGTPVNVIVSPLPTVANVSGGGTVCFGSPLPNVTYTFTGTAPFNFTYSDGTTSFPIVGHNSTTFTITNAPAGTYSVTALSDATTCNATTFGGSVQVIVNPLPTATISGGGTICTGSALPNVTFTFTGTAPYNFTWTDGVTPTNVSGHNSNTFTIPGAAVGTYSITALSDANTCVATSLGTPVNVIVNPRPTVSNVTGGGTVCAGGALPNVTFTFTGTAPYNFTWTNGVTPTIVTAHNSNTFTITNAPAGTYSVTALSDATSCTATTLGGSVPVIVNPLPTAAISGGGTICTGAPLPAVTFTFTGTAPFNFTYTDGTTPQSVTGHNSLTFVIPNAPAGTYSVTALSDANTCVATSLGTPVNVIVNPVPTVASVAGGGTVCAGATLPNVTLTFTGTAPFNFTYTDGTTSFPITNHNSTTFTLTNAPAGTYSVTALSDATTCTATTLGGSVPVIVNPLPTASISGGGTVCAGSPLPTVTFTFTGTAPYDFTYTDGTTPQTVTGHATNSFSITNAAIGTYSVTALSDANTCVATTLGTPVAVVSSPAPTVANVSGGGTVCTGATLPNVTFTFTGTAPFDFTYTDGTTLFPITGHNSTTFTITAATAGTYSVTALSDATTCPATTLGGSVQVILTPLPTATASGGGSACSAVPPDVTFTFTGTAPFDFTYTDGTTPQTVTGHNTNTFTISNAPAGNYSVTALTDASTCSATDFGAAAIVTPSSLVLSTPGDFTLDCAGLPDGDVTFTASGGTAPYQFIFPVNTTGGTTTLDLSSVDLENAGPGDFTIQVTDDLGCSTTQSITISEPTEIQVTIASKVDVACAGVDTGEIHVTATDGTPGVTGYEFSINNGLDFFASGDFTGLGAGDYDVVVRDSKLCISAPTTVTINAGVTISIPGSAITITDATCAGVSDGSISIAPGNIVGGTAPYRFSIDGGAFQPSPTFNGLTVGSYNIVVQDANLCVSPAVTVTINGTTIITATTYTPQDASCLGATDGQIEVSGFSLGTSSDYEFSVDNGNTFSPANPITGLGASTYQVVIRHSSNCVSAPVAVIVGGVATISATVTPTAPGCLGGSDGTIVFSAPTGGTTYEYSVDNGATFQDGDTFVLAAGTFDVVVREKTSLCISAPQSVVIPDGPELITTVGINDATCSGGLTGAIEIIDVTGNPAVSPDYEYSIDNGTTFTPAGTLPALIAVAGGTYDLIVRDINNGCRSTTNTVTVTDGPPLITTIGVTDATCLAGTTGAIEIIDVTGNPAGTPDYEYSLDNGTTFTAAGPLPSLIPVAAGVYDVIVRDINNLCATSTNTVTIADGPPLTVTANAVNPTCLGQDGQINVTSNGTGPFTYSLDNGLTFAFTDPITAPAGSYELIVKDANQCLSLAQTVTIDPGLPIDIGINVTDASCSGVANGNIEVVLVTPDPFLTYQYSSDGGTTFQAGNTFAVMAGTYDIVVTDDSGCSSAVQQVTVDATFVLTADFAPTNATCNGLDDGTIVASNFSGGSGHTFSTDNGVTFGAAMTNLAPGTYAVIVQDADGCRSAPVDVIVGAGITIDVAATKVDATCAANDGSITVTVPSAGTAPFEYSIDNGVTFLPNGGTFTGVTAGNYDVVIKDANGCLSAPLPIAVALPAGCVGTCAQLTTIDIDPVLPTCALPDQGELVFNLGNSYDVTLQNQEFRDNPSDPNAVNITERGASVQIDGLKANKYFYTIKDLFGNTCVNAFEYTLERETIVEVVSHTVNQNVTCFGSSTGSVVISATGTTTGTYFYSFVDDGNTITGEFTPGVPIEGIPATDAAFLVIKIDETNLFLCPDTAMVKVQHLFPVIQFNVANKINVTECNGSDGAFTIENLTGGAGSYQMRLVQETLSGNEIIRDFEPVPGTSFTYDNLQSGTYIVVIQDLNLCTINTGSIIIDAPGAINFALNKLRDTDCGADNQAKNGQIEIALASSGNYQIGLSNSQFDQPDEFVDLTFNLGDPNPTIDTLRRGNWFVFIRPATGDNCPSVRNVVIDGAYALSFAPQRVCNLVGPAGLNLTDVIADPAGSNIIVNIYPSNDLSAPLEPVLVLPYSSVISIDHIALQTQGDYFIEIQQTQALCMITSEKMLYTVAPAMSLVIEDVVASLPDPRQTGSFVLKTIIGGLPLNGDDGLYYIGNLIDPVTGSVIDGPFDIVRNAQGNFERKFKNMPIGTYRLEVTDAYGCQVASVAIVPLNTDLIIPNIFTPNNDEVNDLFEIVNLPEGGKHKLVISNRWGKQMFISSDYKEGRFWDAEDVPEGVYFYRLQLDGGKTYSGWVEIVRGTKP